MLYRWFKSSAGSIYPCALALNPLHPRSAACQTLHDWVKQHEIDTGVVRDGLNSDERERIKSLEREVKELRRANDILKTASAFFAQAELDRRLKS